MAGRRSSGTALASAAELLTQMNVARQDHDRQLQLKAIELYGKFAIDQRLQEQDFQHQRVLKRMELGYPDETPGAMPSLGTGTSVMPAIADYISGKRQPAPGEKVKGKYLGQEYEFTSPTKQETELQRIQEREHAAGTARQSHGWFYTPSQPDIELEQLRATQTNPDYESKLQYALTKPAGNRQALQEALNRDHPEFRRRTELELIHPSKEDPFDALPAPVSGRSATAPSAMPEAEAMPSGTPMDDPVVQVGYDEQDQPVLQRRRSGKVEPYGR